MCEWLSSSEWCDVQLVCGGRTFNAHRAVLASVSVFLRRVLLSCPQEDTPVSIVLPDFDIEAMSSVLYYVYNGEVFVDQHKLLFFFDILKTLQIFIDDQSLKELRESTDGRKIDLITDERNKYFDDLLKMNSQNSDEYLNTEKGEKVQNTNFQSLLGSLDLSDKRDRCLQRSALHPLPPYLDRQRNSFLRDLYIETYPQNGNGNGVTGGVLAISNEHYRAPTSVLLTNANCKLRSSNDDRLSATRCLYESKLSNTRGFNQSFNYDFASYNLLDDTRRTTVNLSETKPVIDSNYDLNINYNKTIISYKPSYLHKYIRPHENKQAENSVATYDFNFTKSLVRTVLSSSYGSTNKCENRIHLMHDSIKSTNTEFNREEKGTSCNFSKVPIFNQVIDSPWRPRLPNNYKPLRRKETHVTDTVPTKKDLFSFDSNNNNVEATQTLPKYVEDTSVDGGEYKCTICSQVFKTEHCLTVHMKRHTTTARYTCSECGKTFSQLRNFKYHVSVHRGTREFAATCTVCGKYFNDRGYLSSHMKIHRNRKEYKCSLCPKSFNQRVAYNMHVRIHTGVKPHVCEECGKAFSRKMLLKQHQRTHSGERPYACPHCDKRFADRSNMTLHLRLHTGVKPFSCSLCPKSFTKKHHLKSHLNFHTGAKPYSCPRCKLAFTQSSNMRTHLKKCTAVPENMTTNNNY